MALIKLKSEKRLMQKGPGFRFSQNDQINTLQLTNRSMHYSHYKPKSCNTVLLPSLPLSIYLSCSHCPLSSIVTVLSPKHTKGKKKKQKGEQTEP